MDCLLSYRWFEAFSKLVVATEKTTGYLKVAFNLESVYTYWIRVGTTEEITSFTKTCPHYCSELLFSLAYISHTPCFYIVNLSYHCNVPRIVDIDINIRREKEMWYTSITSVILFIVGGWWLIDVIIAKPIIFVSSASVAPKMISFEVVKWQRVRKYHRPWDGTIQHPGSIRNGFLIGYCNDVI